MCKSGNIHIKIKEAFKEKRDGLDCVLVTKLKLTAVSRYDSSLESSEEREPAFHDLALRDTTP